MATFSYRDTPPYSALSLHIEISSEPVGAPQKAKAYLRVSGPETVRARWRADFKEWAADHSIEPYARRGSARFYGTTEIDIVLQDWDKVAAFMVRWIGLDLFVHSSKDVREIALSIGQEVSSLRRHIGLLTDAIIEIRDGTSAQEERLMQAISKIGAENKVPSPSSRAY